MIRRVEIRVSLDFEKIKSAAGVSTLGSVAQKLARLEEGRASWRSALAQSDSVSKQLRELSGVGSIHAQMMKDVMAWKTPAMSIAQQYKDLMGEESSAMQTIRQWQEAQRAQDESIRKMIEPLADIPCPLPHLASGRPSRIFRCVTCSYAKDPPPSCFQNSCVAGPVSPPEARRGPQSVFSLFFCE